MAAQEKILIVDDEPFNREIMQEILEDDYILEYANDGTQCLAIAPKFQPDVVLLDINMPGITGYEVCQKLKSDPKTCDIPVTFVSALDSLSERVAGYDAGGEDYITKPFDSNELKIKVELALKNRKLHQELKHTANNAIETAFTAMTSTSELGMVLQFLRASFSVHEIDSLVLLAMEALTNFGLRSTIQTRIDGKLINRSSTGTLNPLEETVISRVCNENRMFDIGNRTIINFQNVSVLLKDMPIEDDAKYGRYKDNIMLLVEGMDERVTAIFIQNDLKSKQNGLTKMLDDTRKTMEAINTKHGEVKVQSVALLADLIKKVEDSFSFLGLSEDQEDAFVKLVTDTISETVELYNTGSEIDSELANIIEGLQLLVDKSCALQQ